MQCRQQLREKSGVRSIQRSAVRSSWVSAKSPARKTLVLPATVIAGQRRAFATVKNGTVSSRRGQTRAYQVPVNPDDRGPINEYDDRVASGRLRDDEHQRGQLNLNIWQNKD
jgi:protein AFG1